jgi:hypothetical protein
LRRGCADDRAAERLALSVPFLGKDGEVYEDDVSDRVAYERGPSVRSRARIDKERAMRRRKLKWLWACLAQIATGASAVLIDEIGAGRLSTLGPLPRNQLRWALSFRVLPRSICQTSRSFVT